MPTLLMRLSRAASEQSPNVIYHRLCCRYAMRVYALLRGAPSHKMLLTRVIFSFADIE